MDTVFTALHKAAADGFEHDPQIKMSILPFGSEPILVLHGSYKGNDYRSMITFAQLAEAVDPTEMLLAVNEVIREKLTGTV